MARISNVAVLLTLFVLTVFAKAQESDAPAVKSVMIDGDIRLSYIEEGSGTPVIFIHGTLGDLYMWTPFVKAFGEKYHAIAYSRRYNFPSDNPVKENANHSTAVEAEDLADFITKLKLSKAHIVGYSYGGYTALHLAVNHPELVRTLVLAEPPLLPWLADMSDRREEGQRMLELQKTRFVDPARKALKKGNEEEAIRIFIDYVIHDGAFDNWPKEVRDVHLRNAPEFVAEVMSKNMFGPLTRQQVASLNVPTLMISGENSVGPLRLTDAELEKTLPKQTSKRVIIPNATHGMWYENQKACTSALQGFLQGR